MIIKWYLIKDKILWTRYVVWWWITIGIPLIAFMSLPKKLRHKIRQKYGTSFQRTRKRD